MKRLLTAAFFLTSTALMAQGVLGVGNFIHVVQNLDKSIEFYHALGLEMTGAPGPRAFSANAVVSALYDAPGAQSRVASFKIPESDMAVEIVEFQGLNATPVQPRPSDPGAITLHLVAQDLEARKTQLSRLKGLERVSAGSFNLVVRDPDGILVELEQPRPGVVSSPAPVEAGYAGNVRLSVAVADVERTTRFYRDALGFTGSIVPALNRARLQVPGDGFPIEFAFAPPDNSRQPVHSEIHDPGSGVLRLRVSDFDAAVNALKAEGAKVVSVGGQPVNLGRNRAVILRDINNLFVQVLEAAPVAGKGPAGK